MIGVIILVLEAVAAAAIAVLMVSRLGSGDLGENLALGLGVFIGLLALALLLGARSLARRGRFGLGFGVTWQLFQALVTSNMLSAGMLLAGGIGLGLAIAGFVVLLQLVRATPLPHSDEEGAQRARESEKHALIQELRKR